MKPLASELYRQGMRWYESYLTSLSTGRSPQTGPAPDFSERDAVNRFKAGPDRIYILRLGALHVVGILL